MKKWQELFDERQLRLIENCKTYVGNDPAGLPGHNLCLIIDKMERILNIQQDTLEQLFAIPDDLTTREQKIQAIDGVRGALHNQMDYLKDPSSYEV